jgi:hypothetical protein
MAVKLFGFEISRPGGEGNVKQDIILPSPDDGVQTVSGGAFGTYVDQGYASRNEADLIKKYREISMHPECEAAIDDIINEAIVSDEDRQVDIMLDDVNLSNSIKKKIKEEFDLILRMLDFNKRSHELFKRWYVDGRVYFHKVVDSANKTSGIQKLRIIDPRSIKFVREVEKDDKRELEKGVSTIKSIKEYFLYSEGSVMGPTMTASKGAIALTKDSVAYIPSGLTDMNNNIVLGYLHKAIKPVNQLRMMEDALVIYRISRAPERRIFYIDVGNLPHAKAEQYLADVMNRYKNKLVYNADTGEIKDDRKHMSMLEDFWLPRREGGRGTEITTLPGGQNLADIDDIEYFKKKLYQSLNVPSSRMEADNGFNMGRASEISRDELKFNKFTNRLQKKFGRVFTDILKTQLVLKEVVTGEEFDKIKDFFLYDYATDNHFTELKDAEILRERLDTLSQAADYVGKYYSDEYIRKYVLRQTEEDIKIIDAQIKKEGSDEGGDDNEDDFGGF